MTEERIIRTYTYPCSPNKGKSQKVKRVLAEYRKTAQDIAMSSSKTVSLTSI